MTEPTTDRPARVECKADQRAFQRKDRPSNDVHGVSTRAMGGADLSKRQVSRLCEDFDERGDAFLARPIEGDWPDLWIGATTLEVRQGGRILSVARAIGHEPMAEKGAPRAIGANIGGCRHAPAWPSAHPKPSRGHRRHGPRSAVWTDVLRDLVRRGLPRVKPVVSDVHGGVKVVSPDVV